MFFSRGFVSCAAILLAAGTPIFAADHFVSPLGGNNPPYLSWADAATNIQDAIDAAATGDTVWVTNGVYNSGGKVMSGDLTNRVALTKPITLQSVNGPYATIIQGNGTNIGPGAIRCAWLASGALLKGFTLQFGSTRSTGTDVIQGGGAYCASPTATIVNCIIRSNSCLYYGAGTYGGKLLGCGVIANRAFTSTGSAVYDGRLINCTVVSNAPYALANGGPNTNCIIYYNAALGGSFGTLVYCCVPVAGVGIKNFTNPPVLRADGLHIADSSPCIRAGTNVIAGTDLDGNSWLNPPSVGCNQWIPAPYIDGSPTISLTKFPLGISLQASVLGLEPFTCWWSKDGVILEDDDHYRSGHSTNLVTSGFLPSDGGAYQIIVSNALGIATSEVASVVIRYVNAQSAAPAPPYLTWDTAAAQIQDAIDVAKPNDIVLVTNGIYATGGKAMAGGLLNRVAVYKPIAITSVNGAENTVIQGAWDPATNGPLAIRCVWLTNGAILNGFTITGGATRFANLATDTQQIAGGVYGVTNTGTFVSNCRIVGNSGSYEGGGINGVQVYNSLIANNTCLSYGGGAALCDLLNCVISNNLALIQGGGADECSVKNCLVIDNQVRAAVALPAGGGVSWCGMINCTVTRNICARTAGSLVTASGAYYSVFTNCIVFGNEAIPDYDGSEIFNCRWRNSCVKSSAYGPDNISADPQFVDAYHLSINSPCRNTGDPTQARGFDVDGQPWAHPPSMGCAEVWESRNTGPLSAVITTPGPHVIRGVPFSMSAEIQGRASWLAWSFGDGTVLTNAGAANVPHAWEAPGEYTVNLTAFNTDHPAGVSSSNVMVTVVLPSQPSFTAFRSASNRFTLGFSTETGVQYVVQLTTNLAPPVSWDTLTNLTGTGNPVQLDDPIFPDRNRFYRILAP